MLSSLKTVNDNISSPHTNSTKHARFKDRVSPQARMATSLTSNPMKLA